MKKYIKNKIGIMAVLCVSAAMLIVLLSKVNAAGAGENVAAAVKDIRKGTIVNESNVDELFDLSGVPGSDSVDYILDTAGLNGMVVAEDISCGTLVSTGMLLKEYGPVSNIKNPVVMGIHAGEASQFVSGIIRRGDTINISIVDSVTDECESVLEDVYVCGAYNDDGSPIEDGDGSAKSLNILVEREDEARINAMLHKGIIRISKTGSGLND